MPVKVRRITVVFNDNQLSKLVLAEAFAHSRIVMIDGKTQYRVDRQEAEDNARLRLERAGKETFPRNETERAMSRYDFVGILIAHEDALAPGRISWAEEVETIEAVTV